LTFLKLITYLFTQEVIIDKQQAESLDVTCNFRLYLKLGRTSVKPSWKHWIFTSNNSCLHTGVPYNSAYSWNRPNVKAQCSLFTYKSVLFVNKGNNSSTVHTHDFQSIRAVIWSDTHLTQSHVKYRRMFLICEIVIYFSIVDISEVY